MNQLRRSFIASAMASGSGGIPGSIERLSLFLDFDGTLVPLAENPTSIRVSPGLAPLLERVNDRLDGRLVLISGRTIEDLDRHLGDRGFVVSGSHGMERRLPGGHCEEMIPPADVAGIEAAVAAEQKAFPDILVEPKRFGVALHYRQAPGCEAGILALAERLAQVFGLVVKRGKMVVELLPHGYDKGSAVEAFMAMAPFEGTYPVFIGDDYTDEDGFRTVQRFGGHGILVGERDGSAAEGRLANTAAVLMWLEELAAS